MIIIFYGEIYLNWKGEIKLEKKVLWIICVGIPVNILLFPIFGLEKSNPKQLYITGAGNGWSIKYLIIYKLILLFYMSIK